MTVSRGVFVAGGLLVLMVAVIFAVTRTSELQQSENQIATNDTEKEITQSDRESVIATWYAPLIPLQLGSVALEASVADTDAKRQQGLSATPYLPEGVVKLFVFDSNDTWSFWMPNMNYPIDIVWLNEEKNIVHIAREVTPESYPTSFAPPVPARYVIETQAGFMERAGIAVGAKAVWGE